MISINSKEKEIIESGDLDFLYSLVEEKLKVSKSNIESIVKKDRKWYFKDEEVSADVVANTLYDSKKDIERCERLSKYIMELRLENLQKSE